jgi:hypothetical protein
MLLALTLDNTAVQLTAIKSIPQPNFEDSGQYVSGCDLVQASGDLQRINYLTFTFVLLRMRSEN